MFGEEDSCDETGEYDVPPELWHNQEDESDDDSDDYEYDIETFNMVGAFGRKLSTDVQSPVRTEICSDDRSADVFSPARPTSSQATETAKQGSNKIRTRSECGPPMNKDNLRRRRRSHSCQVCLGVPVIRVSLFMFQKQQ